MAMVAWCVRRAANVGGDRWPVGDAVPTAARVCSSPAYSVPHTGDGAVGACRILFLVGGCIGGGAGHGGSRAGGGWAANSACRRLPQCCLTATMPACLSSVPHVLPSGQGMAVETVFVGHGDSSNGCLVFPTGVYSSGGAGHFCY